MVRLKLIEIVSRNLTKPDTQDHRWCCLLVSEAQGSYPPVRSQQCSERDEELQEVQEEEEQEDEHPAPMKTRLQKLTEREQERESERVMPETISVSDGEDDDGLPSQWNVEQVFSYIYSLPGNKTNVNCRMGHIVVEWFELLPYKKMIPGSVTRGNWCSFCVEFACCSKFPGFSSQSKNLQD